MNEKKRKWIKKQNGSNRKKKAEMNMKEESGSEYERRKRKWVKKQNGSERKKKTEMNMKEENWSERKKKGEREKWFVRKKKFFFLSALSKLCGGEKEGLFPADSIGNKMLK